MSLFNYSTEMKQYKEATLIPFTYAEVPVGLKEINNVFGKCFFLSTDQLSTVEPKFEGLKYI